MDTAGRKTVWLVVVVPVHVLGIAEVPTVTVQLPTGHEVPRRRHKGDYAGVI